MKRSLFALFILLCTSSVAQSRYSNSIFDFAERLPKLNDLDHFYFSEWELNPASFSSKLSDIETLKNNNKSTNITYLISKNKNITNVEILINGSRFSESSYKNGVLHGTKTIFHENGSTFQQIEFKNGKANGIAKIYDENYKLILQTNYKDNLRNGLRRFTNSRRDEMFVEGNYINDKLVGDIKIFSENSTYYYPNDLKKGTVKRYINDKLIAQYSIIDENKMNGDALYYHPDTGKIIEKIPYSFGKINGFIEYFNSNGEFQYKNQYQYGKKIGAHQFYTTDKILVTEEFYDLKGEKIGTWKTYEREGIVSSEKTYSNDLLEGVSNEYRNGKVTQSVEYKEGKKNGFARYFDIKTGTINSEVFYKNDVAVVEKQFYVDGKLFQETINSNKGSRISNKYFDKEGTLFYENKWNDENKPIGVHKYISFEKDGTLYVRSETEYNSNGEKVSSTIYNKGGGSYSKTEWKDEKWHGLKVNFNSITNTKTEDYYYKNTKVTAEEFKKLNKQ